MKIVQKRVNVIPPAVASLGIRGSIVLAVSYKPGDNSKIKAIGLSVPLEVNSSILPASIGPVTKFNAEGKYVPQRNQPMETVYRQIEWSWEQWNGPYTDGQSCA
jgi:hypothetical protein